jgi:hypothetical protein
MFVALEARAGTNDEIDGFYKDETQGRPRPQRRKEITADYLTRRSTGTKTERPINTEPKRRHDFFPFPFFAAPEGNKIEPRINTDKHRYETRSCICVHPCLSVAILVFSVRQ